MRQSIYEHEGKKYIRTIHPVVKSEGVNPITIHRPIPVDVYCVLNAFPTNCPATDHAIKKLLCAGERGKGNRLDDLNGAMSALNRAIDKEEELRDDRQTRISHQWPPKNQEISRMEKAISILKNYNIGEDGQQAIFCLEKEILPALKKLKEKEDEI